MPGESIIPVLRERLAALETWRDEHRLQHDREVQRSEGYSTRRVMLIAALIGAVAAIIGGGTVALVSYLLSS